MIAGLAARLRRLGLPTDRRRHPLPNTVERDGLLAVLRAGLIAAPLPLLGGTPTAAGARPLGARAMSPRRASAHRCLRARHAGRVRGVSDPPSLRVRHDLPDGVIALDDLFSEAATRSRPRSSAPATPRLTSRWSPSTSRPTALCRSRAATPSFRRRPAALLEAGSRRTPDPRRLRRRPARRARARSDALAVDRRHAGRCITLRCRRCLSRRARRALRTVVVPGPLVPRFARGGPAGSRRTAQRARGLARARAPGCEPGLAASGAGLVDVLRVRRDRAGGSRRAADGRPAATPAAVVAPRGAPKDVPSPRSRAPRPARSRCAVRWCRATLPARRRTARQPLSKRHRRPGRHRLRLPARSHAGHPRGHRSAAGVVSVGGYRFALSELRGLGPARGRRRHPYRPARHARRPPPRRRFRHLPRRARGAAARGVNPLLADAFRAGAERVGHGVDEALMAARVDCGASVAGFASSPCRCQVRSSSLPTRPPSAGAGLRRSRRVSDRRGVLGRAPTAAAEVKPSAVVLAEPVAAEHRRRGRARPPARGGRAVHSDARPRADDGARAPRRAADRRRAPAERLVARFRPRAAGAHPARHRAAPRRRRLGRAQHLAELPTTIRSTMRPCWSPAAAAAIRR